MRESGAVPIRTTILSAALLAASATSPASAAGAASPAGSDVPVAVRVVVVVHVPLEVPHAAPGARGEWYCARNRAAATQTPIDTALLARYDDDLAHFGSVGDHYGFGTWMPGATRRDAVEFEADDHIFITTSATSAEAFLPKFLHRLRLELHQREAFGEVVGDPAAGVGGERRIHVNVTIPFDDATTERVRRLHAIFGDDGRGGASQYDDGKGVHVYSAVKPADLQRISRTLTVEQYRFVTAVEAVFVDDAKPC